MKNFRFHLAVAAVLSAAMLPQVARCQGVSVFQAQNPPAGAIWLDSLDLSIATQDYGTPAAGKTVIGQPLTLGKIVTPHGFGTHAVSTLFVELDGSAARFESLVGVDDEASGGSPSIQFSVIADGKKVAESPVMHHGDTPYLLNADLTGVKSIILIARNTGDTISYDHADWGGAYFVLSPGAALQPKTIAAPTDPPRMVVPPDDPRPAIHGPQIIGASPGKPFLFLIPATGSAPLTFSAAGLPAGLSIAKDSGIISGSLVKSGRWNVSLAVKGPAGSTNRRLIIVGSANALALTPPMGWNSWYVWGASVTQPELKAAAKDMVSSGLAAHGYSYIDIDDGWAGPRDGAGKITSNNKFPSIPDLSAGIHSLGLKFGIYSSPGPTTCAGYPGSYQHEASDAETYAEWGVDFVKYDWCSYSSAAPNTTLGDYQKPYLLMDDYLRNQKRDMIYNLCQYGMGDVWKWGAAVGGNAWRVSGDSGDQWGNIHGEYESEVGLSQYAGPGHWNDPDYLMLGYVGFGTTRPTRLSPNEQIVQVSMWSMLAAPLFISSDMAEMNPLTKALLSNDEVLDLDQDMLGKEADRISAADGGEVWSRPLSDSTTAVALVNTGPIPQTVSVTWVLLGIKGPQPVRDLWLHKNIGSFSSGYSETVPSHGIILIKIGKPRT